RLEQPPRRGGPQPLVGHAPGAVGRGLWVSGRASPFDPCCANGAATPSSDVWGLDPMPPGPWPSYGGSGAMSTSTGSITTRLRTWLFLAGLTVLLLVAGALVGGVFLYGFVALAVVMNIAGYWFSDRIALFANRARPLSDADAPGLHAAVAELAQRAGI